MTEGQLIHLINNSPTKEERRYYMYVYERYKLLADACKYAYQHSLTNYIQLLSEQQLDYLETIIINGDVVGVKINILECIKQEREYRKSEEKILKLR